MKAWLAEFIQNDRTFKWIAWFGLAAFLLALFSDHQLALRLTPSERLKFGA
jgi:hypothetical protein